MHLKSPCKKVNLLLNILGKRADGFHELETVMQPVNFCDELSFERAGNSVELTCSEKSLPVDSKHLVHRAATGFLAAAEISGGVKIHLEKKFPLRLTGLGGGSGNAATTLLGLNELFGSPLSIYPNWANSPPRSVRTSISFSRTSRRWQPAAAKKLNRSNIFPALRGKAFFLVHPGFGIFHTLGLPESRAVSAGVEWAGRPRPGDDRQPAIRGFARRRRRFLQ